MGQASSSNETTTQNENNQMLQQFQDLKELPPEVAISVLSNLNATDLCLASCVWKDLAEDDYLWKGLCLSKWKNVSVYDKIKNKDYAEQFWQKPVYKNLYLAMDEGSLIYASNPNEGIRFLIEKYILEDSSTEIGNFIHGASLNSKATQIYVLKRVDVLKEIVKRQDFSGLSLTDSLRMFFEKVKPPQDRGDFLHLMIEQISTKYLECNPDTQFDKENLNVLCYSILLLSVDLYSPHVKMKMTKREFIKNVRHLVNATNVEYLSDVYDDVYLNGHIVPENDVTTSAKQRPRFPFYRPYGAIFELKPPEMKLKCSC